MLNEIMILSRKAAVVSLDCLFLLAALAMAVPFVLMLILPVLITL